MKKFLAVCVFLALSGATMAYDVTTAFQGTVDVKFNWVNFSDLDPDIANCNDWYNFPVKYDAYLVLCYDLILCPVCPFGVDYAGLWLVDKKTKQEFFADTDAGGISSVAAWCFGNGNVGVAFTTFLPYYDENDQSGRTIYSYVTSPEVMFVLAGTRSKPTTRAPQSEIANLNGGVAYNDIAPADRTTWSELECDDASETLFADVSFKKLNLNLKPDPWCPECSTDCDSVYTAVAMKVEKAAKRIEDGGKYYWWVIDGQDSVIPWILW